MGKLFYSKQFYSKTFGGVSTKEAYLKACKWYATNIIAEGKFKNVSVEYKKEKCGNAVTIVIYTLMPEKEVLDIHCENCRSMHSSFFMNEDTNCNRCSAISFHKRLENKISVTIDYYKSILKNIL